MQVADLGEDVRKGAGDLFAAPVGTTQKLQYLLHPSMMDTKADEPSTRAGGRWSNFSISGKEMSTCGLPLARRPAMSSGRRCSVCGPNTRSTYGARRTISPPSWLATHPPTPMRRSGLSRFKPRTRPRSANTFSCAFSRTEQVLKSTRSACAGSAVCSKPSAAGEHVGHLRRVVLVHLAAERADEYLGTLHSFLGAEVIPYRGDAEILQKSTGAVARIRCRRKTLVTG